MPEFYIREFREEDLPALARHWEASVKGWPAGFIPAGDWSPEGVREWLQREKYIACWLGWFGDEIVAYLSYCHDHDDTEVSYVSLLNAHPGYHGKSFGRKILVHAVDRAVADKVKRLDLHTWSANKKAVPLYKKCGFFWKPRTTVFMYNFLPTVLNNAYVKDFLGDTYWYDALSQELEIVEDSGTFDGCFNHKYTFKKGDKFLEVLVDPSTSGVAGIKTDEISIRCLIEGEAHIAGYSHPVKWVLRSDAESPISIKMKCETPDGVDYSLDENFSLSGEKIIETSAMVAPDVRRDVIDWYGKKLDCTVEINGMEISFAPGIRVTRPLELEMYRQPLRLSPGEEKEFTINFKSAFESPVSFQPEITAIGDIHISDIQPAGEINIDPADAFGLSFRLRSTGSEGSSELVTGGRLTHKGEVSHINPIRMEIGIYPLGKPVHIKSDDPKEWILSNGMITVIGYRKDGFVEFFGDDSRSLMCLHTEKIGEPFSDEFKAKLFDIAVDQDEHSCSLVFKIDSVDFPGITLVRSVTLGNGKSVCITEKLINKSDKIFNGSLRVNPSGNRTSWVTMPVRDRVISGSRESWLDGNVPMPTDPSAYPEQWLTLELKNTPGANHSVIGLVYDRVSHIGWPWGACPFFEYKIENLKPGESVTLPPLTAMFDVSGWQEVQKFALKGATSKLPTRPVDFIRVESPVFPGAKSSTFRFYLSRQSAGEGCARLKAGKRKVIEKKAGKWNLENPIEIVVPSKEKNPGLKTAEYFAKWLGVERGGELAYFATSPGHGVKFSESSDSGKEFYSVDNGSIEYRIAPGFSGTMYWLSRSGEKINLLRTGFPEEKMWSWWNPWFGGIIHDFWMNFRFHNSEFSAKEVRTTWRNLEWSGISVEIILQRQWRSARMESLFLTRPGIPAILNLVRIREESGCARHLMPITWIFPRPSGNDETRTKTMLDTPHGNLTMGSTEDGQGGGFGNWAACYDPESLATIGIISSRGLVGIFDAAHEGQVIETETSVYTKPGETIEYFTLFTLTDDPGKIKVLAESIAHWDRIYEE